MCSSAFGIPSTRPGRRARPIRAGSNGRESAFMASLVRPHHGWLERNCSAAALADCDAHSEWVLSFGPRNDDEHATFSCYKRCAREIGEGLPDHQTGRCGQLTYL